MTGRVKTLGSHLSDNDLPKLVRPLLRRVAKATWRSVVAPRCGSRALPTSEAMEGRGLRVLPAGWADLEKVDHEEQRIAGRLGMRRISKMQISPDSASLSCSVPTSQAASMHPASRVAATVTSTRPARAPRAGAVVSAFARRARRPCDGGSRVASQSRLNTCRSGDSTHAAAHPRDASPVGPPRCAARVHLDWAIPGGRSLRRGPVRQGRQQGARAVSRVLGVQEPANREG